MNAGTPSPAPSAPESGAPTDAGFLRLEAPAAAPVFAPGALAAGRFRIERLLDRGGMGEVYAAFDLELGEPVAVKTIAHALGDHPAALARFRREIQLAHRVTHPNVCRIFDLFFHEGEERRVALLTMELLDGETLAARLARAGPIAPAAALPLLAQIAGALAAAHAAGVVHRDLKCSNVVLVAREEGGVRAVLTDFGVARALAAAPEEALTREGAPLGTPAYMAPEQRAGGAVGPAADVYALGIVAFEMVTGERPGAAPDAAAFAALPPAWRGPLARALAADPAARFGRVEELPRALAGAAAGGGRRALRLSGAAWLALALALGLAAVLAEAVRRARAAPPVALAARAAPPTDREAARLYAAGLAALRATDYPAARARLEEAAARAPESAPVQLALARVWGGLGSDRRARAAAERALALAPAGAGVERLLAEGQLRLAAGEPERALEALRTARALLPGDLEVALQLAGAERDAGRPRDALATLAAARPLALDPVDATRLDLAAAHAHFLLADVARQLELARAAAAASAGRGERLLLAAARWQEAIALRRLGETAGAERAAEEARRIFAETGNRNREASVSALLASHRYERGELAAARREYERALAAHESAGDRDGVAQSLNNLGNVAGDQGDFAAALDFYERAAEVSAELGDQGSVAAARMNRALLLRQRGELPTAERELRAALAVFRALGDAYGELLATNNLGTLQLLAGDPAGARSAHADALAQAERQASERLQAYALHGLGRALAAEARSEEARGHHQRALALREKLGERAAAAESRLALAEVELAEGRPGDAAALAAPAAAELDAAGARDRAGFALALLATAERGRGDLAAARAALAGAEERAGLSHDAEVRLAVATARGLVDGAAAATRAAGESRLAAVAAEAERLGLHARALEARLAACALDAACDPAPIAAAAERRGLRALALRARAPRR